MHLKTPTDDNFHCQGRWPVFCFPLSLSSCTSAARWQAVGNAVWRTVYLLSLSGSLAPPTQGSLILAWYTSPFDDPTLHMHELPSLPFSSVLSSVPDSPGLLLVIFLRIPASSIFISTQHRDSGHSMPASHCLTALPDFCLLKKKKRAPSWVLHDGLDSRYTKFIVCTQWRPPG